MPEVIKYFVNFKTENLPIVAKADEFIQQLAGKYSKECVYETEKILNDEVNY